MATLLLRVVHCGKMIKISKHGWKLKLLSFSTELLSSFEIFHDYLFLMAKSKNAYMCHVIKIMTSSASVKWSSKRKMCFLDIRLMFSKTFRYNTKKPENMFKSYLWAFQNWKQNWKTPSGSIFIAVFSFWLLAGTLECSPSLSCRVHPVCPLYWLAASGFV